MPRLTAARGHLAAGRFCAAPALALILGLAQGLVGPVFAQDKGVDLRLSLWVPPAHPLTGAAKAWAEDIANASDGTIKITIFPSEQLGKAFDHYDIARDDIADITYVNPGYQPGRFPVIAIGQMPFTFGDARNGTAASPPSSRASCRSSLPTSCGSSS
jgi:TRAP-type C4-dicarboxylate transport system substrate-binding protein